MTRRRDRSARLFAIAALGAGALAAWLLTGYTGALKREAGRAGPVLVAAREIPRGTPLDSAASAELFTERRVPYRFAPVDAVSDAADLAAARALVDLPAGAYITRSAVADGGGRAGYRLRKGERAVTVEARLAPDGAAAQPGTTIDLVASGYSGGSDAQLLISRAEILAVGEAGDQGVQSRVTVRVNAGQVPAIVRADVFARELRAIIRP